MVSVWYNIVLASSNFVALYFSNYMFGQNTFSFFRIEYFPMIASFLYHLAETKNDFPGIYPLNKYTMTLLNLDRFFAVSSAIIILFSLKPHHITIFLVRWVMVAFIALIMSESAVVETFLRKFKWNDFGTYRNIDYSKVKPIPKNAFLFLHGTWHIIVFYIFSMILNE